jgi:DNA topoisomerase-3
VPRTLIIAEKPSVAEDIAKVVGAKQKGAHAWEGEGHVVSWAVGHLLEFMPPEKYDEKWKRWRLQDLPIVPSDFKLEPTRGAKKQLDALKKYLKDGDVDTVVNACDAGREGELIFREIYRWSGSKKPVQRLWLQSMTKDAIKRGLAAPKQQDDVQGLADAADCRAESDWLIGMNATRALTVRLRSRAGTDRTVWSAGRVQTATLAMLVRREREILEHEPRPYWLLQARFAVKSGEAHEYDGTWVPGEGDDAESSRIFEPERRDALLAKLQSKPPAHARETRKDSFEAAPPLFDLTSLQREANRRLGFSARRTLQAAQGLYEAHKLITYPRTDSRALPEDYRDHVKNALAFLTRLPDYRDHAARLQKNGLENQRRNFDDGAVSDHFAIVPTGEGDASHLKGDEAKIWDLVVRRFLAAFHPPAISTQIERTTECAGERFRTRRKVLKVPGWRAVWEKKEEDEEASLPALLTPDGTGVAFLSALAEERETTPPPRLTEGTLLSLMESAGREVDDERLAQILKETGGLGTPATRADIIETLENREYMEKITGLGGRKALRATARGIRLIEALERIPIDRLTSPVLTAGMEDALRDMQHGRAQRKKYMGEVRAWTQDIVERVRGFTYDGLFKDAGDVGSCPLCQSPVRESLRAFACARNGKDGDCSFVIWKEVSGRVIDRRSVVQLLRDKQTPPKAGFFSRDGREYEASLRLDGEGRIEVVSRSASDAAAAQEATPEAVVPLDIGPCPYHAKEGWLVRRSALGYRCDGFAKKSCKLNLPLELCKRKLSPDEIMAMLADAKSPLLEGFISKRGRPFAATLHLEAGRIRFEFPPRGAGAGKKPAGREFQVNPEPLGRCPVHKDEQVRETPTHFKCGHDKCKLAVPRELCQRELTRAEAEMLVRDGKTPVLDGFLSKRGKPFRAALRLKRTGGHEFEFEDE